MKFILLAVLISACGHYEEAYVEEAVNLTQKALDDAGVTTGKIRIIDFRPDAVAIGVTAETLLYESKATIVMPEIYDPVLFHEIGHALGLTHVEGRSIMNFHVPNMELTEAIDQLVDACRKQECRRLQWRIDTN